jgi:hypothetical protein
VLAQLRQHAGTDDLHADETVVGDLEQLRALDGRHEYRRSCTDRYDPITKVLPLDYQHTRRRQAPQSEPEACGVAETPGLGCDLRLFPQLRGSFVPVNQAAEEFRALQPATDAAVAGVASGGDDSTWPS